MCKICGAAYVISGAEQAALRALCGPTSMRSPRTVSLAGAHDGSRGRRRLEAAPMPDQRPQSARARERTLPRRVCAGCGNAFAPSRPNQKHCRPSCRALALQKRKQRAVSLLTDVGDAINPM